MTSTPAMQEPLVSDAQISDALRSAISHQHYITLYDARMVMQKFRGEYEAKLRELEADNQQLLRSNAELNTQVLEVEQQLAAAQAWEAVGNGDVVGHNLKVESEPDGSWLLWIGGASVTFPPTVRLQRRTVEPQSLTLPGSKPEQSETVAKAEVIRARWAADWHREGWHKVSYEYVHNEIRDLLDVIALLAQQAQAGAEGAWEPVADGTYHTDGPEIFSVDGAQLTVFDAGFACSANLQQGYAVCKRTTASAPLQPPTP